MRFLKNHAGSIVLFSSMVIGFLLGLILKEDAGCLEFLGAIFINLLSSIIVPLIFVTISLGIAKVKPKKAVKLLRNIAIVFGLMTLISVFTGVVFTNIFRLVSPSNSIVIDKVVETQNINIMSTITNMFSVSDFHLLLSKENIIALITFSIICGFSINMAKESKDSIISFLEKINDVLNNIIKIIMYYAPVGICAYFAVLVGSFGAGIAADYIKVFIYYTVLSFAFAFVFYSIIAVLCKKNIKTFWKEALPVLLASVSTCSSASCMPINLRATKRLGVNEEVSDTTISLGTSFHKDGSVIDSVFKIMFLVYLFNSNISIVSVVLVSILASLLITAVPIGGGTISEMLIITLLGFPVSSLPILTVIATITDAPATMLNSLGDTASSLWVDKLMKKDTN